LKKVYLLLHIAIMIYAAGGIFSKQAAQSEFMSVRYCICYAIVLAFLIIYAVIWQYILKYLPLTTAIAHKSVTVFWGFLYGMLFFQEKITLCNIIGAILIMIGIGLVNSGER
jgi:drug/metabolite transporter (DMT)-like permease